MKNIPLNVTVTIRNGRVIDEARNYDKTVSDFAANLLGFESYDEMRSWIDIHGEL